MSFRQNVKTSKRQNDGEVIVLATAKIEELKQEIEELKEDNGYYEERSHELVTERNAALDMLESDFCKSEMLAAMIEANHKLEAKLIENEL